MPFRGATDTANDTAPFIGAGSAQLGLTYSNGGQCRQRCPSIKQADLVVVLVVVLERRREIRMAKKLLDDRRRRGCLPQRSRQAVLPSRSSLEGSSICPPRRACRRARDESKPRRGTPRERTMQVVFPTAALARGLRFDQWRGSVLLLLSHWRVWIGAPGEERAFHGDGTSENLGLGLQTRRGAGGGRISSESTAPVHEWCLACVSFRTPKPWFACDSEL